jgi:hypothetical protein
MAIAAFLACASAYFHQARQDHLLRARPPVFCAAMLAVFAVWGLSGFGYPSAPLPCVLNVVSKILGFITALTLFVPQRANPGKLARAGPALAEFQALHQRNPATPAVSTSTPARGIGSSSTSGIPNNTPARR